MSFKRSFGQSPSAFADGLRGGFGIPPEFYTFRFGFLAPVSRLLPQEDAEKLHDLDMVFAWVFLCHALEGIDSTHACRHHVVAGKK